MSLDARIVKIVQDEVARLIDVTTAQPETAGTVSVAQRDDLQRQITDLRQQLRHVTELITELSGRLQPQIPSQEARRPTKRKDGS